MSVNQKIKADVFPTNGAAKVYYKNLQQLFEKLQSTNPALNKIYFCNYLLQAKDVLSKLQKSEPLFDCTQLIEEYNTYESAFLKV